MGSQQFCLKWNNHQSNMLVVFDQLLQNEAFVDVTLACEGLSIKAHKMVLSACSPYFQNLFLENPCKHPIVILNSIRYCDLKAIVDFMYKGEVNVSQEQLSALLKTAEALKVKGLAEVTNQAKIPTDSASSSTPPPTQHRTTSPPPKRKKTRNGSSPTQQPKPQQQQQHQQHAPNNNQTSDLANEITTPKIVLAMSELSQDTSDNDHDGQRSAEEMEPLTQLKEDGMTTTTTTTTTNNQSSERITSSPEPADDKSYLRHLTNEMICEGSEKSSKELPQTQMTSTTTLSSLLTSDIGHSTHTISMVPSTSGTQNSTHDARMQRRYEILEEAKQAVLSGQMKIVHAALHYGIPNTTLWRYVTNRRS